MAAGKEPLEFPYLDPPSIEHLEAGVALLIRLGCIRPGGDGEGFELTNSGRLFNELPFDPRLCSFVLEGLAVHNIGPLCTTVAALLAAPGSVFFFGKKDDNAQRQQIEADLAKRAAVFDSDLLLEVDAYRQWARAGLREHQGGCKCKGPKRGSGGCTGCRKRYASEHALNNKVLEAVHATIGSVERELKRERWASTIAKQGKQLTQAALSTLCNVPDDTAAFRVVSNPLRDDDEVSEALSEVSGSSVSTSTVDSAADVGSLEDLDDIRHAPSDAALVEVTETDGQKLGSCLLHAFPEQVGALIVPGLADSGIRLLQGIGEGDGQQQLPDVKAKVDRSSTVHQRARSKETLTLFAVMETQQMTNGLVVARKLHPLTNNQLTFPDPPQHAVTIPHLGKWPADQVKVEFDRATDPSSWQHWAAPVFDAHHSTLSVYAKASDVRNAKETVERVVRAELQAMRDEVDLVHFGGAQISVGSGLVLGDIAVVADKRQAVDCAMLFKFTVKQPPRGVRSKHEAFKWVTETLCPTVNRMCFEKIRFRKPDGTRPCPGPHRNDGADRDAASAESASGAKKGPGSRGRCTARVAATAVLCKKCQGRFSPQPGAVEIEVRGRAAKETVAAAVASHHRAAGITAEAKERHAGEHLTADERRQRQLSATIPLRHGDACDYSQPEAWAALVGVEFTPQFHVATTGRHTKPEFTIRIKNFMPSTKYSKADLERWLRDANVRPERLVYQPEENAIKKPSPHIMLVYSTPAAVSGANCRLQLEFQQPQYQHSIILPSGHRKTVQPVVEIVPGREGSLSVTVTFPSPGMADVAATSLPQAVPGAVVKCTSVYVVKHAGVFPGIDGVLQMAQQRTGCKAALRRRSRPRHLTVSPPHKVGLLLQHNKAILKEYEEAHNVKMIFPRKDREDERNVDAQGKKPESATIEGDDQSIAACIAQMNARIKGVTVVVGDPLQTSSSALETDVDDVEIRLVGQRPSQLAAAHASLVQAFTPTTITVPGSGKLAIMYEELRARRCLEQWASDLNLHVETRTHEDKAGRVSLQNIRVFGPGQASGVFFKHIADYCDDFERRYLFYPLTSDVACLFKPNRIGDVQRAALSKRYPDYTVHFSSSPPGIEMAWPPEAPGVVVSKLKAEALALLRELGHDTDTQAQAPDTCMWCQKEGTKLRLGMCGHGFCLDCVETVALHNVQTGAGGVMCPLCPRNHSVVLPYDVKRPMGTKRWETFVKKLTVSLIKAGRTGSRGIAICPNPSCDCITAANAGYSTCSDCLMQGCASCGVVDDLTHNGRTCAEFQAELRHRKRQGAFFSALEKGAEEFVRQQWPADLPAVVQVRRNPAMDVRSNAEALRRFRAGMAAARCSADDHNISRAGHFAWHGTSEMAVPSICDTGFDPSRRSGQACGRGECVSRWPSPWVQVALVSCLCIVSSTFVSPID